MNRIMLAIGLGSMLLGACNNAPQQAKPVSTNDDGLLVVVGSYCSEQQEGIRIYSFNEDSVSTEYLCGMTGVSNPSYLTPNKDGSLIFAVCENKGTEAAACAISFDRATKDLELINKQPTGSGDPCYISLTPDEKHVLTANYDGGSISMLPIDELGRLEECSVIVPFEGKSWNRERQTKPHVHCVEFTPDESYLLAPDLGADKIHVIGYSDSLPALLDTANVQDVRVPGGSGPRHITFHPNGQWAYLITELSGKVICYDYDAKGLHERQALVADTLRAKGSADIHVSPDGKFLYTSHRLRADGIAIYSIDQESGRLKRVGYQHTLQHPRNFAITPDGKYLFCACRDAGCVQIFRRNPETGSLTDTKKRIMIQKPSCIKFIGK